MNLVPTALALGLASLTLVACSNQSDTATADTAAEASAGAATLEAANDTAAAAAEATPPAEAK